MANTTTPLKGARAALRSPTGLFWSERGRVTCAAHTPFPGSDTWVWDRWEALPTEALLENARLGNDPFVCECCRGRGE